MKTFKLLTESIRQDLPHISSMNHEQLTNLTRGGRVHLHHVTEKTDGSTFMIGHDERGFYTQSSGSGSERMRTPQDYLDRVVRRAKKTGKEPDFTGARAFADAHESLQRNSRLQDHLRSHAESQGGSTQLRGELFSRSLARPSEDKRGEVKIVGTSYDPSSWGSKAKIVIHSKLPENQSHDTEHFKKNLSNDEVNFDDDIVDHKPIHVDVSHHMGALQSVNHEILKARTTKANRTAKQAEQAEQAKLATIAKSISDDVDNHVTRMGMQPKFGSGTEGAVVHPSAANPSAPRFKITSDTFRAYRADPENKEKFKKRTISQIKEAFLAEGGNVKVKTDKGEVSSGAFAVGNRTQQRNDVYKTLSDIHDAFHQEHGEHLFGRKKKGLSAGSIYGGSTKHFMDTKIGDDEFKKHKPSVGDLDVQVTPEHKEKLTSTLKPGRRFGPYTVVGTKKHGKENSAVMRHDNGEHHQFDFEGTDYHKDEPTKAAQFLTSSDWKDTKVGIKGAHHKILINAAGGSTHKFSIMNGLRSRTDDSDPGTKEPEKISSTLFGQKADHPKIHSFLGVSDLIKKHIPKERHQEIYDKFKSGLKSVKADHGPALSHLRRTLGVKDTLDESADNNDHHTTVIPMVGFSPISHMGHAADLGGALSRLPGTKHVGISSKSDVFTADERKDILSRQWGKKEQKVHIVKGAGETVRRAYDTLPEGRKHLHILVGHDRRGFAEGLKSSLEAGKIKEMGDKKFHSVTLHYPEDSDISHGMSGTNMRRAAAGGDVDEVHRHLGPSFSRQEAQSITKRMRGAIDSGKLKLVRESTYGKKSLSQLKEQLNIGLTFARKEMPQLGASRTFIQYMKNNDIDSMRRKIDPAELKSSQMEFDRSKIEGLKQKPSSNPIIVSNDGYVVDGHHRWLADSEMGRKCDAYVVDMPVLDLLHKAKHYTATSLQEEITRKELAPMLDSFVSFASDKLGLKSMPNVRYKTTDDDYNSFAAYNPSSNELSISTMNRHPMDIFRSVAHELVHHKQNEDGKLGKDIAKEGETGSDIENEANAEAGKIMRWFAKTNPNMFGKSFVVETNTAAMAPVTGIRGLGNVTGEVSPTVTSQYVLDNQNYTNQIKNNTSGLWNFGDDESWMDAKGKKAYQSRAIRSIRTQLSEGINDPGKLKAIFLAGGPGSGKDFVMNSVLAGNGLKEINSDTAFEYLMKKNNLDLEMPDEERLERDIVRGRAKGITKEKERLSLVGRLGVIINGTADDLEKIKTVKQQLENDGYETMMVFVNTSNEVSRQRNVDRGKMGMRKVPDGTDKQGNPDNSPDIRQEKWDLAQKNIGELQKIFGNEKFTVIDNTADMRKVSPEEKEKIQVNFNRVRRMAQQFVRAENNNPNARKWIESEAEKRGITYQEPRSSKTLTQIRQSANQVVHQPDNSLMLQARRLGLSYYGFGRFGRKVGGVNKVMFHSKGGQLVRVQTMNEEKKMKNDPCWKGYEMIGKKKKNGKEVPNCVPVSEGKVRKLVMSKKGKVKRPLAEIDKKFLKMVEDELPLKMGNGLPVADGYGPETSQYRQMAAMGFGAGLPVSESIQSWMHSEKTQQKFYDKYGNLWEEKLIDTAIMLEEAGCGTEMKTPKSVKKLKEFFGAASAGKSPTDTMSPLSKSDTKDEIEEENSRRGADSKGLYRPTEKGAGLTRKGAKHFGIKTAVTTPPSKLDPKGKAAKRRKSFCARMGGMPGPMKDEKGRPTRKAMSLRRWNCEE